MNGSDPLDRLVKAFRSLPGVGRRSAERMARKVVLDADAGGRELVHALEEALSRVCACSQCGHITLATEDPCRLCSSPDRDDGVLCVVEESGDIELIEASGAFRGRYHALMGKLSPRKHQGPADLRIERLTQRIGAGGVKEVILALNSDVEGDATARYLLEILSDKRVKVSRLGLGLPAGGGITYADPITLARALAGRQPIDDPDRG